MKRKVELLAPAGSIASLKAAISAGADAVYIGGQKFGARAFAKNPETEDLLAGISYAHLYGKQIYLTVNTLIKERELEEFREFLTPYYEAGIDGVIVQDLGIVKLIHEEFPGLPIHASTQMSLTTKYGAQLLKDYGLTRIVPARELTLEEVREIKEAVDIELECFIHGAMCVGYSGQCLFSSMLGGRSGNRGACAQPCRLPFSLGDNREQTLISMKDMETLHLIPQLIQAGVVSFKIEGRMKSPDYVYQVVKIYRKYIDLYLASPQQYQVAKTDVKSLQSAYRRRGYSNGYYKESQKGSMLSLNRPEGKLEEVIEAQEIPEKKITCTGRITIRSGQDICFRVNSGGSEATVYGVVPSPAMNQPLSAAAVEKRLKKTGNTPFVFAHIQVDLDEGLYLAMGALNEIRRIALESLKNNLLDCYLREQEWFSKRTPRTLAVNEKAPVVKSQSQINLIHVSTKAQLEAALSLDRDQQLIGTEAVLSGAEEKGYLELPIIFRPSRQKQVALKQLEKYRGVYIHNLDELAYLKENGYQGEIIASSRLYTFNEYAVSFLKAQGVDVLSYPLELNRHELRDLNTPMVLMVYGRIPLMVTAQQVTLTEGELVDRYQKKFPVKNSDKYCYNVIYNSAILSLLKETEALQRLSPQGFLYYFTDEEGEEVREVLLGNEVPTDPGVDYTKGHWNRGV
ncbi:putative protease [Lachnospiraceae bacterium PF1-21]|uniref:peptidase U32 family protein n=1 Tax=Ohessyouella blattaphilus TaxID=2949333 RepID=UPI003E2FFD1E